MKRLSVFILTVLGVITLAGCKTTQQAEAGRLGLPGDNLNLYAVLKLFQESPTLESFERSLNDSSGKINNLDLNGDNKVDYIRVIDSMEGNVHNIILRAEAGQGQEQNVAVIVLERLADNSVNIQVVGDEDLYGKDYIIEPNYGNKQAETPNPAYQGNEVYDNQAVYVETTPFEIAAWPVIVFIYGPGYVPWYSPWYWDYYPAYWIPWIPFYWHYYFGYHYYWNYYYFGHYHRTHSYKNKGWREHYYNSSTLRSRSTVFRQRVTKGDFRKTYSKPVDAQNGATLFRQNFPKAPTVNKPLPKFRNSGAPVIKRKDNFINVPKTKQMKTEPPRAQQPRPTFNPSKIKQPSKKKDVKD